LRALWAWSEEEFLRRTEGSPIRRIGIARWRRNIAVALGNALRSCAQPAIVEALRQRQADPDPVVQEHVIWALAQTPLSLP